MSSKENNKITFTDKLAILSKMVRQYEKHTNIISSIQTAKELTKIIDELRFFSMSEYSFMNEHYSQNSQKKLEFLNIILENWPKILKELDLDDCENNYFYSPCHQDNNGGVVVPNSLTVFETENIFEEAECISSIVKQNKQLRICIIALDESFVRILINNLFKKYSYNIDLNEIKKKFDCTSDTEAISIESMIQTSNFYSDNILIIPLQDIKKTHTDLTIISSTTDKQWRSNIKWSYWIDDNIRKKIGLPTSGDINNFLKTNFYHAIALDKVYATFSQKINNSFAKKASVLYEFQPSQYVRYKVIPKIFSESSISSSKLMNQKIINTLSGKDIELLTRDPFSFYIKNELNIKPETYSIENSNLRKLYKKLVKNILKNELFDIEKTLYEISKFDFYKYQNCKNITRWFKENLDILNNIYTNIYGECDFKISENYNIKLYGYADGIIENKLIICRIFAPKVSINDIILENSENAPLISCVIAQNCGFLDRKIDITKIEIWNMNGIGTDPVDILTIEISNTLIENFEKRLQKLVSDYMNNQSESSLLVNDIYRHYKRIKI
ncbi:MAG: hypothetical protein LBI26_02320 [Holosporales bacterium]|jgi:hypothetical protein|nr:hypothetical protein [Holosporales bacterium]